MFTILADSNEKITNIAAVEFAAYTQKITGKRPTIANSIKDVPGDVVVMGDDSESPFIKELVFEWKIDYPQLANGGDDYIIVSNKLADRTILVLAGGRPRSLMYAVYSFFEIQGCSYFWDGDIIPHKDKLKISDFNIHESPHFEYRGLRYFAHRSLHRFQAEHWNIDEWKREIDWILKKRLNMFMLRIGMDDLFQKAFPEVVPYPENNVKCEERFKRSYNDCTHFWSLQERGKLRKALLDYAFERDLLHIEDTGTITHWYSRTPNEYLDKINPDFVPQNQGPYAEPTGRVWDVRNDENIDNYFKLTQAHIDNYGKPDIFHTIGLAERDISNDMHTNHLWKLYAYRRIIKRLRKSYPDTPLLIGTWDFFQTNWTFEEIHDLLKLLDPKNTLIFDYTSDCDSEYNYFMNWGIYQKFPWIFGIFQAYESGNDLRGNYSVIKRRLEFAANDHMCKGMVIWPENSHANTLMYEFFAINAWDPQNRDIDYYLPIFCSKRYGENSGQMLIIWQEFLPVIKEDGWNYFGEIFARMPSEFLTCSKNEFLEPDFITQANAKAKQLAKVLINCQKTLKLLSRVDFKNASPMMLRDCLDLARTAVGRLFQYLYNRFVETMAWPMVKTERECKMKMISVILRELILLLTELLEAHEDYSLYNSIEKMRQSGEINPVFEETLKANAENNYCRSYIFELCRGCYKDELEVFLDWAFKNSPKAGCGLGKEEAIQRFEKIKEDFYRIPLSKLAPEIEKAFVKLPETMNDLSECAAKINI